MTSELPDLTSAPHRPGLRKSTLAAIYLALSALPLGLAAIAEASTGDPLAEGATAAGMVGMAIMVAQLGSSGRFKFISGRVGIDVTMAFHKWAAPVGLLLLAAHPVLLAGPFDSANPIPVFARLLNLMTAPKVASGSLALVLFFMLTITAVLRDRLPIGYGLWRLSHGALALAALVLSLQHILTLGAYADVPSRLYWLGLTLGFILFWLSRHFMVWLRTPWRVTNITRVAERLWFLQLENKRALSFRAGQFVWLRFGNSLSDHPFSIASAPGDRRLGFLIQQAGDFTALIGSLPVGSRVVVDGPHGSFTTDGLPPAKTLLLIAGGVGVAPLLSILSDLGRERRYQNVRLIYAVRNRAELVKTEILQSACPWAEIAIFADDASPEETSVGRGPLTTEHIRALFGDIEPSAVNVLMCGPGGMMTLAADALLSIGVPSNRIRYERFSYGTGPVSAKDQRNLMGFFILCVAVIGVAFLFAMR